MTQIPPIVIEVDHRSIHAPIADWYQTWSDYLARLASYHAAKAAGVDDLEIPSKPDGAIDKLVLSDLK